MGKRKVLAGLLFVAACVALVLSFRLDDNQQNKTSAPTMQTQPQPTTAPEQAEQPAPIVETSPYAEPVAEFKARITKKRFGDYITPATSPVQPERFSGFHTGVDVEYQDVTTDVPVSAISDGEVVYSQFVSGYGGVVILRHTIGGTPRLVLYGHLRPSTLPVVGSTVTRGQIIGQLGTGFTTETDNERKHLHFAIIAGTTLNLRGYATSESALKDWIDPLTLYP